MPQRQQQVRNPKPVAVPGYFTLVYRAAHARVRAFGAATARSLTLLNIENAEKRDEPSSREFEISILHALDGR